MGHSDTGKLPTAIQVRRNSRWRTVKHEKIVKTRDRTRTRPKTGIKAKAMRGLCVVWRSFALVVLGAYHSPPKKTCNSTPCPAGPSWFKACFLAVPFTFIYICQEKKRKSRLRSTHCTVSRAASRSSVGSAPSAIDTSAVGWRKKEKRIGGETQKSVLGLARSGPWFGTGITSHCD